MAIGDRMDRGESAAQAGASARRELGNLGLIKEVTREMWGWSSFERLLQDLRYGARMLVKSPGFTAVAILTLALGIGANTAIFSLIDTLFLRPLPVRDPSQLVDVYQTRGARGYYALSLPDYYYFRDHSTTFSDLTAHYSSAPINMARDGESRELNGSVVTDNYFSLLGIRPLLGRFFLPEENQVPDRNPVAVISYGLWEQEFGGDPQVLGQSVRLNGRPFTIVGITPASFHGVVPGGLRSDLWIPSMMFHAGYHYCDAFQRDCTVVKLIGRLKRGHTPADAQAELNVLARRLEAEYPDADKGHGVSVTPARGVDLEDRELNARSSGVLLAAVAVVLLIACTNLAGLLLARNSSRRKEIAVRLALGAGRQRLIRQLLTESLLLSLIGGAVGLLIAAWSNDFLSAFYATDDEGRRMYFNLGLDATVTLLTFGLSVVTGIAFGLLPALQASRPDVAAELKEGAGFGTARHSRLRDSFVVAQTAFSIVLVVGAGLLVRSLRNVYRGPGFDPGRVLLLRLRPALVSYSPEKALAFQREAIRRIKSLPGVLSASPAQMPPLPGWG